MKRLIAIAALVVAALWTGSAGAQVYPSKLVRLLCWTSAGSPLDVMMRQIGKQFGEMFGQTFVVENRPGGEGVLAMSLLQNAPADGYTILSTTSSMSFAMAASDRIKFGPADFIILPALQAEPSAVAVRADSRFKTALDKMWPTLSPAAVVAGLLVGLAIFIKPYALIAERLGRDVLSRVLYGSRISLAT